MSKHILVISTSFRHEGNSDTLAEEFMKGAELVGHKTEKISLSEHEIHFCLGCGYCANAGVCVQKDDMAEIMAKMMAADVIVLATPVYFYSIPGQLKTMIDRTIPIYKKMQGKEFYYILTAADSQKEHLERVVETLRGYTKMCIEGCEEKGILYATGLWQQGAASESPYMQEAYKMGKNV